ncbi:MAG: antirestriction protein [Nitrospira sp.]|nr:antirestriction protein [Nitrospira sp.]
MKSTNVNHHPIVASLVPDDQRLDFLPRHFGTHMMLVERQVYQQFANLAPQYRGGYWKFYELSNGGCYLAPSQDFYHLVHPGGDFDATVSGDAAGIVATLYTFSHLAFHFEHNPFGDRLSDLYHRLRDYVAHHPEADRIFRIID